MNEEALTQEEAIAAPPMMGDESETAVAEESAVVEEAVTGPRLVVKRAGAETDIVFAFTAPALIGRFDVSVGPIDIDMTGLDEGVYVSRKHAKITEVDGVYSITDLGSSNGTFVAKDGDFQRVEEAVIESGTEIALGNARFVFHL
jgi:pSer/pThr/pTyr-binding forkhead associated (FHA) protein